MTRARKNPASAPVNAWDLTRTLAVRALHELLPPAAVAIAAEPLGEFAPVACEAEWARVQSIAAARDPANPKAHLLEAIGDAHEAADDAARTQLAFCQTPGFVAEYLLDHVLLAYDNAHFGPYNVGADNPNPNTDGEDDDEGRSGDCDQYIRLLDPSCGSGHLLVRAVRRIVHILTRTPTHPCPLPGAPPTNVSVLVRACNSVTGYELNPQVAALARARAAAELLACPAPTNHFAAREYAAALERILEDDGTGAVQVRDSLLFTGAEDDRFEMIVGNPPYITPKDAQQREQIRKAYASAHGRYGLHGPFIEAALTRWVRPRGFIAYIVSNNFMKREWGKPLIEQVIAKADPRIVVDTSGAFIPGHGTPTVILGFRGPTFAPFRGPRKQGWAESKRGDRPVEPLLSNRVCAIQGKRGEPSTPADPAQGRVWQAIRATRARTLAAMARSTT